MGGGRGMPICMVTPAIVGIGTEIASAKKIAPKNNFFILSPPGFLKYSVTYPRVSVILSSSNERK
jgi:hypothetical protein